MTAQDVRQDREDDVVRPLGELIRIRLAWAYARGAEALYDNAEASSESFRSVLADNPHRRAGDPYTADDLEKLFPERAALTSPASSEPEWHRIARDWQSSGNGAALAALATGAWTPPLDEWQWDQVRIAAATIPLDHPDIHKLRAWLYGPEASDRHRTTAVL